jgi:hypothetical protein
MDPFFLTLAPDVGFSDGPFEVPFFRIEAYGCGEGDDPVEVQEQGVVVTWRDYMGLD